MRDLLLAEVHRSALTVALAVRGRGRPMGRGGTPHALSVHTHSETVLWSFYNFHRELGLGPMLNLFPLDRSRSGRRVFAHRNVMAPPRNEGIGLLVRVLQRVPRRVPDEEFNGIFVR